MQMDALNKTIRDGGDPVAKYVDEVAICGDPIKVVNCKSWKRLYRSST